jgi:glycosyltransferase involved in cell wall biosynthesis
VGMVANFKKIKNHLFLLEAFDAVAKQHADVKLLLVGQGFEGDAENTESDIRTFVKNNMLTDRVIITGYRADVPELLRIMDVFCLMSLKEGQPISIIEAMAAGLPIIGTDVPGIRDIVQNECNGILIALGFKQPLIEALLRLRQDCLLRTSLGRAAKNLAHSAYSIDRVAKQYGELFHSLVNTGLATYNEKS